jgi:hypothetical protein
MWGFLPEGTPKYEISFGLLELTSVAKHDVEIVLESDRIKLALSKIAFELHQPNMHIGY